MDISSCSEGSQENDAIITELVKQGKYDEVMKYLTGKELKQEKENEENPPIDLIPADGISFTDEGEGKENNENASNVEESQSSVLLNVYDNNYDELLGEKDPEEGEEKSTPQKETEIHIDNAKNLELLTKELQELENCQEEDNNNIEQMNEMYLMIQEDHFAKKLQTETRLKLFPNYLKTNINLHSDLKSDLFLNLGLSRNFYVSSMLIKKQKVDTDIDHIDEKFLFDDNFESPFDEIGFNLAGNKNRVDYDSIMLNNFEKEGSKFDSTKTIEDLFEQYQKSKNAKPLDDKEVITINISIGDKNNESENNKLIIVEKVNSWIKNSDLNHNPDNEKLPADEKLLQKFTSTLLNNFTSRPTPTPKNMLELTLSNQNLQTIPKEMLQNCTQLRFLNLEENQITKIENLSACTSLYSLNLSKNMIKKIENISHLKSLEKLTLNYNFIEQIENCQLNQKLKFLSLGKNKIHSIETIESQLLYIEELTLCENSIRFIPEKFSLPYIKYLDLNENKIQNLDEFLYLPCLEKLLLKDNKIEGETTRSVFEYCDRLREIDLSFNKIEYVSFVLGILSKNQNIEIINVSNNPFIMPLGKFCTKYFKKLFPKLKMINNENIKKEKIKLKPNFTVKKENLSKSYYNVFLLQTNFMRFFSSVVFVNKIYNVFDLNINSNLSEEKIDLVELINSFYFLFKRKHLKLVDNFFKGAICDFSSCSKFQNFFLSYLYDFKHKMVYLKNSMGIFSKNLTLRVLKIEKIQQMWKMFFLRKQLKAIKFVDNDRENCDELLDFFDAKNENQDTEEPNFDWENDKLKEIEQNLINIGNSIRARKEKEQKKKEEREKKEKERKEKELLKQQQQSKESEEVPKENSNTNDIVKPPSRLAQGKQQELEVIRENENEDFQAHPYLRQSINELMRSKQLTPLKHQALMQNSNGFADVQGQYSSNQNREIEKVINNLSPDAPSTPGTDELNFTKTKYYPQVPNKYRQGDNIQLRVVNMNNQMRLPSLKKVPKKFGVSRPESNIILPSIKRNETNSVLNDDTKSVKSTYSIKTRFTTTRGRVLPPSALEAIKKLEDECRETIKKAKGEWEFTNQQTVELLVKKITKNYKRQINKILEKY